MLFSVSAAVSIHTCIPSTPLARSNGPGVACRCNTTLGAVFSRWLADLFCGLTLSLCATRWSNGRFKATLHAVLGAAAADGAGGSRRRFSLPFFYETNLDCVVSPLNLQPGQLPLYGPTWPSARVLSFCCTPLSLQ